MQCKECPLSDALLLSEVRAKFCTQMLVQQSNIIKCNQEAFLLWEAFLLRLGLDLVLTSLVLDDVPTRFRKSNWKIEILAMGNFSLRLG